MKKSLLIALGGVFAVLFLTGCPPYDEPFVDPVKPHVAQTVDLRNKKGEAVSELRSVARASGEEFSYKFLESVPRFISEDKVEKDKKSVSYIQGVELAKIEKCVKIEDHKDGIKFTFTRPEGYTDKPYTWVNVQYLDEVGHKSTGISFNYNQHKDLLDQEKIEIVYPLVDPTKETDTRFWIQLCNDGGEAQLMYKVVPVNGYGCVDAVQEDYKVTDYLGLSDDGVMTLKLTIPPVAKEGTLKHNVGFYAQSSTERAYDGIEKMGIFETASDSENTAAANGEEVAFKVDFKERYESLDAADKADVDAALSGKSYVWASLIYSYQVNVEGLEDYIFETPWVISNIIKNPIK